MGFRETVGDYQRQLFLIDHAGLPPKVVLEQLDLLGGRVVPVLRREFAALRPAHVPDAPTRASLRAARDAAATEAAVTALEPEPVAVVAWSSSVPGWGSRRRRSSWPTG